MNNIQLKPLSSRNFLETLDFLKKNEKFCVSLTSHFLKNRKPCFPDKNIHCWVLETSHIEGIFAISDYGLLLQYIPLTANDVSMEVAHKIAKIIKHYPLYCLTGIANGCDFFRQILDMTERELIAFQLMELQKELPTPLLTKNWISIQKATVDDLDEIFPLQKKYELEEVIPQWDEFNEKNCKIHLRAILKKNIHFILKEYGNSIAKVGTNAEGFHYAQIGGMYTVPEKRQQGYATVLLKQFLIYLNKKGYKTVLFVKNANKNAYSLYKKIGFDSIADFSIVYY